MKINIRALGFGFGIFWGGAILSVGIANLIWPDYGTACLQLAASIYPGYDGTGSVGQVAIGTLYGMLDGFIAGLIFGWLYNLFVPAPAVL